MNSSRPVHDIPAPGLGIAEFHGRCGRRSPARRPPSVRRPGARGIPTAASLCRHVPRTRPREPCPRPARGPDDPTTDSAFARKRRRTVRAAPSSPSRSGRHSRLATKKPDPARYRRPPDKHPHSRALARQKAPGKHRARQPGTTREPPRRRARWRRQPERMRSGAFREDGDAIAPVVEHAGIVGPPPRIRGGSGSATEARRGKGWECARIRRAGGGRKGAAPADFRRECDPADHNGRAERRPRRVRQYSPGEARHRAPHSAEFEHPLSPRGGRNSSRHHASTVPMTARNAPATRAGKRARAPCRIGPRHPSRPVDAPCSPGPRAPAERARRRAHFAASPPRRKEVAADDGVITESGHIGTWRGIPWAE